MGRFACQKSTNAVNEDFFFQDSQSVIKLFFGFCFFFGYTVRYSLNPQPWIEPTAPALEVQSLHHWTIREVPVIRYLSELSYIQISRESVFLAEKSSSMKALDWESPLYVETYQEGQQTSMSRTMILIIWEIFRITNYWALSQTYWLRNSGARAWKSVFKK